MNKERLMDVVKVLRELAPDERNRFDMGTWSKHKTCGTVACAVGWYINKRQPAGLRLTNDPDWSTLTPTDDEHDGCDSALRRHFEISFRDIDFLFYSAAYDAKPDSQTVADRIERFVATGEIAEPAAAGGARDDG